MQIAPWIFGARRDLAAFTGTALFALALVWIRRALGWSSELPEWGWVAFVLAVDVAHVYATLFRTYLDGAEVARHRLRYFGIPLAVYIAGFAMHLSYGGLAFFRVLSYLAVLHFVRQQIGWAALYRRRGGGTRLDEIIDDVALYAATGYPLLYWHAHLPDKSFAWLVPGDFLDASRLVSPWLGLARAFWVAALAAFALRQVVVAITEKRISAGKCALVSTTAATWYVGIVGSTGDFDFTVTNVLTHGVPYMVLLFSYGRAAERSGQRSLAVSILARGAVSFVALLLAAALVEEAAWDRFVWHDHEWLFGASGVTVHGLVAALVVPLLAVPQATHYVFDGLLWRRREPALRAVGEFLPRAGVLPRRIAGATDGPRALGS